MLDATAGYEPVREGALSDRPLGRRVKALLTTARRVMPRWVITHGALAPLMPTHRSHHRHGARMLQAGAAGADAVLELPATASVSNATPKTTKAMKDQLAIVRPRKVQSTTEQSPLP